MKISFVTSDKYVWNWQEVCTNVTQAMVNNENIEMLTTGDGPCIQASGIAQYLLRSCRTHNYDPSRITIRTQNQIEHHDQFKIDIHRLNNIKRNVDFIFNINKNMHKHFGIFVMRSSAPRLDMASYLYKNYYDTTTMTYHFSSDSDYHRNSIGLEELIQDHQHKDITTVAEFLTQCPIKFAKYEAYDDTKGNTVQQLNAQDRDQFFANYNNFFVEIACETYYSGHTFFPTEKVWRPMLLMTPFIVHGPQHYIKHLHNMGFKTFDGWWNEGYSQCDPVWQLKLIKEIVDDIATWSMDKCQQVYKEMQPILQHNKQLLESWHETK